MGGSGTQAVASGSSDNIDKSRVRVLVEKTKTKVDVKNTMPRTSQRSKRKVDYSKLGQIEGMSSDEDLVAKSAAKYESDSEEFHEEENGNQPSSDEEILDDAPTEPSDDEIKPEDLDDSGVIGPTSSKKKSSRGAGVGLEPMLRTPGQRLRTSVQSTPATPASNSKPSSRAENLKERFQSFYGNNDLRLVEAITQRAKWQSQVFIPDKELFEKPKVQSDEQIYYPLELHNNRQQLSTIPFLDAVSQGYLPSESSLLLQTGLNSPESRLYNFNAIATDESGAPGIILNAGAFVTSVSWAQDDNNVHQYLAVGTLDKYGDLTPESIASSDIGAFAISSYPSAIQIYQIGLDLQNKLYCCLLTKYGSAAQVRWRPCPPSPESGSIGILAACFQDGKVRVFNVPDVGHQTEPVCMIVEEPMREFAVEDKITCLTWRTANCISVGTADGFIAEFDISDESDSGSMPSFHVPLHLSIIASISSGYPDNKDLLFTTSVDGYTRITDIHDVFRARSISTRYKVFAPCSAYSYHLSSFVCLDDAFTSKLAPIRKLNRVQAGANVTKHDGGVISVSASLQHPIILSGGSDGTLRAGNAIRRALVSRRVTTTLYRNGLLWAFETETTGDEPRYRFVNLLKSQEIPKHTGTDRQTIYPASVGVTAVDWNPSLIAGGLYAAGISCGLIRIDNLALAS